jgi:flagellar hook assembly protein FlgD
VTGYVVYVDGQRAASTAGLSASVTGADCSTPCQVTVEAHDAAGNASPRAAITVTTPAPVASGAVTGLVVTPKASQVKIGFTLTAAASVSILVLDGNGNIVTHKLTNVQMAAGPHAFYWKLKDDSGRSVAPGTYDVRVTAGSTGPVTQLAAVFNLPG